MKTGLFFGSFNPIHNGHMAIAEYIIENTDLEELWFIVSPMNPLKKKKTMLEDHHRLELVYLAVGDDIRFKVSDIEFSMPKPSFTVDTLTYLSEKYPNREFEIILGSDNLMNFHRWKNSEILIQHYKRLVYPRHGNEMPDILKHKNIEIVQAPRIEISSSFIRESISKGKKVKFFMPLAVWNYIDEMNFYK
ncbi:MAG: nicotinate-nucleotide adenylyltransferase [Bacteroidales bacterium]|nr:nicotinate-nucleotide adenylyltransferase [Bacteroidales bacterium]MCF8390137.1 nicotinate-nucleotide adenylyltransferase [Bacteroidales bacterium]